MYTTIKTLWEKTKNKTEIARITGHDWKTVAKVIKNILQVDLQGIGLNL